MKVAGGGPSVHACAVFFGAVNRVMDKICFNQPNPVHGLIEDSLSKYKAYCIERPSFLAFGCVDTNFWSWWCSEDYILRTSTETCSQLVHDETVTRQDS